VLTQTRLSRRGVSRVGLTALLLRLLFAVLIPVYCGSIYDTCPRDTPAETCLPVHHETTLHWMNQQTEQNASRWRYQTSFNNTHRPPRIGHPLMNMRRWRCERRTEPVSVQCLPCDHHRKVFLCGSSGFQLSQVINPNIRR
jgi:hypothetical protein